jgi:hypothetical protein
MRLIKIAYYLIVNILASMAMEEDPRSTKELLLAVLKLCREALP